MTRGSLSQTPPGAPNTLRGARKQARKVGSSLEDGRWLRKDGAITITNNSRSWVCTLMSLNPRTPWCCQMTLKGPGTGSCGSRVPRRGHLAGARRNRRKPRPAGTVAGPRVPDQAPPPTAQPHRAPPQHAAGNPLRPGRSQERSPRPNGKRPRDPRPATPAPLTHRPSSRSASLTL